MSDSEEEREGIDYGESREERGGYHGDNSSEEEGGSDSDEMTGGRRGRKKNVDRCLEIITNLTQRYYESDLIFIYAINAAHAVIPPVCLNDTMVEDKRFFKNNSIDVNALRSIEVFNETELKYIRNIMYPFLGSQSSISRGIIELETYLHYPYGKLILKGEDEIPNSSRFVNSLITTESKIKFLHLKSFLQKIEHKVNEIITIVKAGNNFDSNDLFIMNQVHLTIKEFKTYLNLL